MQQKQRITIAVSGGSTPKTYFKLMAVLDISWGRVDITLADERVVDTTSPDSNQHLVRNYLLQNNAVKANYIGMDGKFPIDILILGMGADGHIASLFPNHEALQVNDTNIVQVTNSPAKYDRVSITTKAIADAKHVLLAYSGDDKQQVLEQVKQGKDLPVKYALQHPNLQVFKL